MDDKNARVRPPDEVLDSLPDVYARTLLLLADGAGEDEISERLGVPAEAVAALIELARRKADRAMADRRDQGNR
ncbi:MAG: hypothetical protein WD646_05435 [Actinomycetota bacterium]